MYESAFKWLSKKEIKSFKLDEISENSSVGYVLEVDLKYCWNLHDLDNNLDKVRYVIHYKNVLYYLSLGMKLVKIHRVLSFKQSNWLKPCVEFNTQKRKQSTNEADKDFCKLIVDCIYGKVYKM